MVFAKATLYAPAKPVTIRPREAPYLAIKISSLSQNLVTRFCGTKVGIPFSPKSRICNN